MLHFASTKAFIVKSKLAVLKRRPKNTWKRNSAAVNNRHHHNHPRAGTPIHRLVDNKEGNFAKDSDTDMMVLGMNEVSFR
jgi:hypothetical protein